MKQIIILSLIITVFFSDDIFSQKKKKLSPGRKQAIDSLALEKVRDLSKYISIIGNKATHWSEANRVIESALELFMKGSEMGVSSLYVNAIKYYPIKKYLERLSRLNYDKVTIKWFKIQYISDLVRQPDGKYVGVITIFQKFEGTTKDGSKYVDITQKDITIYVERKKTQIDGISIGFWDVLLGDIRVAETKKK